MDNSALVNLVGGPILSMAVAYILGRGYRKDIASCLAFGLCVAFALATSVIDQTLIVTGPHDPLGVARLVLINCFAVLGSAYLSYEHVLRPTGLADKLNAIGPQVAATPPPAK